jgi:hypothetical protein
MAETVQAQPEPEYGAKVEQERNAEALAAAQPAPGVPLPEPAMPEEAQATGEPEYFTVQNPYMLLPASINFPQQNPQKTPVERDYDVGLLWNVLADSSSTNQSIRTIAKRLLGGE